MLISVLSLQKYFTKTSKIFWSKNSSSFGQSFVISSYTFLLCFSLVSFIFSFRFIPKFFWDMGKSNISLNCFIGGERFDLSLIEVFFWWLICKKIFLYSCSLKILFIKSLEKSIRNVKKWVMTFFKIFVGSFLSCSLINFIFPINIK